MVFFHPLAFTVTIPLAKIIGTTSNGIITLISAHGETAATTY
jgi:hypothetical protein